MIREDRDYALCREAIRLAKRENPRAVKILAGLPGRERRPEARAAYYWHQGDAYCQLKNYEKAARGRNPPS